MIGSALNTVADTINEYLSNRYSISEDKVVVSNLVDSEGNVAVTEPNKLVLSLVNLQPEKIAQRGQVSNKGVLNVNLYVLFSSTFSDLNYAEGLDYIAGVMSFFHANNVLNHSNAPNLDSGLEKLTFDIFAQDLQDASNLWGALGAKYMPSVIYKMRMVTLKEGDFGLSAPLTGLTTRF
ncbi:hypothetical protein BFP72_06205 [Reichenbachiella sp. 5M10]|uniref:DUF4255 domain-containing protein n=1 Tax=Reichenbachiella sp. 5M10 TaxID=1889772 RepID=UPI000C149E12|nr:DUF4255 domain-containing protein [Reichenbachiella sp. 5M10]PIB35013.1 hypothetical protein BFP72_06205 [Reichenbachiella sp. 5M10]